MRTTTTVAIFMILFSDVAIGQQLRSQDFYSRETSRNLHATERADHRFEGRQMRHAERIPQTPRNADYSSPSQSVLNGDYYVPSNGSFDASLLPGGTNYPATTNYPVGPGDGSFIPGPYELYDPSQQRYPDSFGNYPFVTGDIFGVSLDACCDEWRGHCECLALTNSRSNCSCTNPYRQPYGSASCDGFGGRFDGNPNSCGCSSCAVDGDQFRGERFASRIEPHDREVNRQGIRRSPISDYFHPRR